MSQRIARWKSDTQFNYQQPYYDAPVFTHTEVVGSGDSAKIQLAEKADNSDDITYTIEGNYTLSDSSKITIANGVGKLKSGTGVDINFPMTDPANYNISDSDELRVSGGYAELYCLYLYAFWKFNESSGSNISDSSGNNRDGTAYNMEDADWQAGKLNNCLRFNEGGSTNEYSLFGNIAAFERTDSFSYEWWMKGTDGSTRIIFSKTPYGAWHGLEVFIISGKVSIYLIGSGEQIYKQGSVPINTGGWMHCVITYNGNSDHSGIKIYINSVECGAGGSGSLTTSIVNSSEFQISGRGGINNFVLNDYMIDAFRIFTKELSQSEINYFYNSGAGTGNIGYPTDYPYITNKTGVVFTAALTNFVETATKDNGTEIKWIISDDDGTTKYYWTGVTWAVSDGTYAQSSLATDINANLATWSSSGTFKWYALLDSNSGVDTPLLDNLYITSPSNYPTDDNLYIDTKDAVQIAPTDIFNWLTIAFTKTVPANTDIKVLISVDGRSTWLGWGGSSWDTVSGNTLRANATSLTDAATNFSSLSLGSGTFDIRVFLYTSDNTVTPQISNINVTSDAGYETSGSYVSTNFYPADYFFNGFMVEAIEFDVTTPSGTDAIISAKFRTTNTIDTISGDYVIYNTGDDINFEDAVFLQWKVDFTGDGSDTPYLNYVEISFKTLLTIINDIEPYIDATISSRSSHNAVDVWAVATRTLTSFSTLVNDIWSVVVENSKTALQMMRIMFAVLKGKSAGGGTNTLTFRDDADSKDRITATVDVKGNRTNVVVDGD